MPSPPRVAVIYDIMTLAPRRIIVHEDHEDGDTSVDFVKNVMPGEDIYVLDKSRVRGMQLYDIAVVAILEKTGRQPPTMEEVHAADAQARALRGG